MPRSINLEPNWDGMRRWVRNIARTDLPLAHEIASNMGDEAPDDLPPLLEDEPDEDDATYRVRRFFLAGPEHTETIETGLTLEEAQAHCQDPETSSRTATGDEAVERTRQHGTWFDGYEEE